MELKEKIQGLLPNIADKTIEELISLIKEEKQKQIDFDNRKWIKYLKQSKLDLTEDSHSNSGYQVNDVGYSHYKKGFNRAIDCVIAVISHFR